jgi:dehydrogenase/reductase SDR family protein 7B
VRIPSPRRVLITGAAGAIGASIARAMRVAWPEAWLALVDRIEEPMRDLATELGHAATYVADLRDVDALPALIDRVTTDAGVLAADRRGVVLDNATSIDCLVNCAGIKRVQQLASWSWDDASSLLAVDLLAPLRLQDLVVRGMIERGHGLIVNVASMAGRVPLLGCTYYGAAKAGLSMASEIARAELAPRGVQVLTVYPGPVRSALEAGARAEYGGGGLFGRFAPTGDPDELARRIMHAIERDEARVIYPRLYGVGWTAPNLSSWFALSYGPPPVS